MEYIEAFLFISHLWNIEASMNNLDIYLRGEALYGDDFNDDQLREWFESEFNTYSDKLGNSKSYDYKFYAVDKYYGFKYITEDNLNVLGIGSANGAELIPILDKIKSLTILENSNKYESILIDNKKINYLRANYRGVIDSPDNYYDLVICFSTLHHIANVSFVISEMARVLKRNKIALIREPIISMGDWNKPRVNLSKNERGIPLKIFRESINKAGFKIISESIWNFRPLVKLLFFYKDSIYNNLFLTIIDQILSYLFRFNIRYYPTNIFHKVAPSAVFLVLKKL